ncbi:hypothetical protein HanXRQr2_Chr15g0696501 [Helianthus annuus]|uniref:Uncharacterized protein n=1 Tax=Helianthus annuus TaxID=4232 RepID=A0A251S8Q9_HELAN|nr:hypothetical protein HanXRQr2_Chr15g0696501 [Helianthus annuus]KAJ0831553.1 hypothetical protein HanPSC8_Chr15g0668361 [Helianthus annuus]
MLENNAQGIRNVKRTRRRGYAWKRCALKVMLVILRKTVKQHVKEPNTTLLKLPR